MNGGGPGRNKPDHEFYPTPWQAIDALWRVDPNLRSTPSVWEPACGDGAIAKFFQSHRRNIVATDLNDHGYGQAGINFLSTQAALAPTIVTNPPFSLAEGFITHAYTLRVERLYLLLKSSFFHAEKRRTLFKSFTPIAIYPLAWRLDFLGYGAPAMECAWFVWDMSNLRDACTYMPALEKPTVPSYYPTLFDPTAAPSKT